MLRLWKITRWSCLFTVAAASQHPLSLQLLVCCLWCNIYQPCDKLRARSVQALFFFFFCKKAPNANEFPLTPTGFLSCGSNQRWESVRATASPTYHCFHFHPCRFLFLKCHLPSCSCPVAFLGLTNTDAPALCHYYSTAWINSRLLWRGFRFWVEKDR